MVKRPIVTDLDVERIVELKTNGLTWTEVHFFMPHLTKNIIQLVAEQTGLKGIRPRKLGEQRYTPEWFVTEEPIDPGGATLPPLPSLQIPMYQIKLDGDEI